MRGKSLVFIIISLFIPFFNIFFVFSKKKKPPTATLYAILQHNKSIISQKNAFVKMKMCIKTNFCVFHKK